MERMFVSAYTMDLVTCPDCTKRVSSWEMSTGKCLIVNRQIFHKACLLDKNIQDVAELAEYKPQKTP